MSFAVIRCLLADDHGLVREALAARLAAEPGIEVVAAVADAGLALQHAERERPDVVLLDIDMPGPSPFEAATRMRQLGAGIRVLFVSGFVNDGYIERALAVEAAGYLSKHEPPEVLIRAIRLIAAGSVYFSPQVQARIVVDTAGAHLSRARHSRIQLLTPREVEMLGYLARGFPKKQMARLAGISVKTVEQHCTHIMQKLDIHDRVELARFAIREGLTPA